LRMVNTGGPIQFDPPEFGGERIESIRVFMQGRTVREAPCGVYSADRQPTDRQMAGIRG
jgi:hypothetical protein